MRKLHLISTVLLVSLVSMALLAGCETQQLKVSASSKPAMTDSDLESSVRTQLGSDPQLKDADLTVSANAESNTVTLSGTVESDIIRTRAIEVATNSQPGVTVSDTIVVKIREIPRSEYTEERASEERSRAKELGDTIGQSLDDAWVHMKIATQLAADTTTPRHKINVDVTDGVVTLRGTVDTGEQKSEAERIAKETEGVKQVRNELRVS